MSSFGKYFCCAAWHDLGATGKLGKSKENTYFYSAYLIRQECRQLRKCKATNILGLSSTDGEYTLLKTFEIQNCTFIISDYIHWDVAFFVLD
eukprot:5168497-Amphidinium_carterae.1